MKQLNISFLLLLLVSSSLFDGYFCGNLNDDFSKIFGKDVSPSEIESDWPALFYHFNSPSSLERLKNADKEDIQRFISFLDHPNLTIKRSAFIVIGIIANGTDVHSHLLIENGLLQSLNKHFYKDQEQATKVFIGGILLVLAKESTSTAIIESEIFKNFISLLPDMDEFNLGQAVGLFTRLGMNTDIHHRCFILMNIWKDFNTFLDSSDEEFVHGNILMAISLTMHGIQCDGLTEFSHDLTIQVFKKLYNLSKNKKYRMYSLSILSKFSESPMHLPLVVESGVLEYMNEFLQDPDYINVLQALGILGHFAGSEHHYHLISEKISTTLEKLYKHEKPEISAMASLISSSLSLQAKKQNLIDSITLHEMYAEKINEIAFSFYSSLLTDQDFLEEAAKVFDGTFIEHIIDFLENNNNAAARNSSVQAIIKILKLETSEQFISMAEKELLPAFCNNISSKNVKLIMIVINKFLTQIDKDVQEIVCKKLEDSRCLFQIRKLSPTNLPICTKATPLKDRQRFDIKLEL